MKKAVLLLLAFVLLAGLFAGCASNADPGDNTRDGIIGRSYEDTRQYDRSNRWTNNNRNGYNNDNDIRDYDVTEGVLTDRNNSGNWNANGSNNSSNNNNNNNNNSRNSGNSNTSGYGEGNLETNEQSRTGRAS